jgi:hypothetical protein
VCALSQQQGAEHKLLRAASLQCLSAMVNLALQFLFVISVTFCDFLVLLFGSSLQLTILILMQIWFMKEHSYIFAEFDEVTITSSLYGIVLLIINCDT